MSRRPGNGTRRCDHAKDEVVLLAVFGDYRLGVLDGESVVDVSHCFPSWRPSADAVGPCIGDWDVARPSVLAALRTGPRLDTSRLMLLPPVPRPRNLLGAPVNYHAHRGEVKMDRTGEADAAADARSRGFFVKSAASIVGPADSIELPPLADREFAYEGEVAFVVGRPARAVTADTAWDHIFGLTGFIDVTLRPSPARTEERSMRKSFQSFGPLGPWIWITDTPPDPSAISLKLFVNDELRQEATLSDLIQTVPDLMVSGSSVIPLEPGDVFATGTPSGVGSIVAGDVVTLHVCPIGEMSLEVVERGW